MERKRLCDAAGGATHEEIKMTSEPKAFADSSIDELLSMRQELTGTDTEHFNRLLRMQFVKTMEVTTLATVEAAREAMKAFEGKEPALAYKLLQRCADNTQLLLNAAIQPVMEPIKLPTVEGDPNWQARRQLKAATAGNGVQS